MLDRPFTELLDDLAARRPTPGGGAAAAMAACSGAAVLLMVVRFCKGKKASAPYEGQLAKAESLLDQLLERLRPMAERDAAAFGRVATAYSLPKEGEDQQRIRKQAIQEGLAGAMVVPEECLCLVRDALRVGVPILPAVGKALVSDLGVAASLLNAGADGCRLNVLVNANYLDDRERGEAALQRAKTVHDEVLRLREQLDAAVAELLG